MFQHLKKYVLIPDFNLFPETIVNDGVWQEIIQILLQYFLQTKIC